MVDPIDPTLSTPPPVTSTAGQLGHGGRQQQQQPQPQSHSHTQPQSQPERKPIVDIASVLGLSENVMPAALQGAFLQLVQEVERLRDEIDRVRLHEAHLLHAADHHALLPALNRRAFMAGLNRILEASERAELPGSLAYLHIGGIEFLRRTQGLLAGDAALAFVAASITNELRQTDLLAYLDGSDFAVALAVASDNGAEAKISLIVESLRATPLFWQEQPVVLAVTVGLIHFQPGMTADQAIIAASQAMISGTSALSS
jgi:diguanylate cyclase (GGDEF)-like protein